jgi:hypothetical protein
MKRYRVWEANRKIFLFPENWLEPEFRDDKTHLFTELEGALLQGDVSSDLVEDAFLKYLKRLDELARLDIRAMHIEDNFDPARRVLHVIGRTYAQPYKYFYRRYAHQMWTQWEPVSVDITDPNAVLAPVVWRDRFCLFWITFLEKADPDATIESADDTKPIAQKTVSSIVSAVKTVQKNKVVELQLHWAEYLHGEWNVPEAGGFVNVIKKKVPSNFSSDSVLIHVSKSYDNGEELGVCIHIGSPIEQTFYLEGRNSNPLIKNYNPNGDLGTV